MEQITSIRSALRSGRHNGTLVNGDGLTLAEGIMGETGRVELLDTIDKGFVAEIKFKREYKSPVVIAYITTRTGNQSVEVRVKDVTPTSFFIFMEAPDDATHSKETACYFVIEAGSHITTSGYRIEAGVLNTTIARKSDSPADFKGEYIKFGKLFTKTPVVLHSLNSYRNNMFATSMIQKVTTDGFEIAQELAETKKTSANEAIAWIAMEPMQSKGQITNVKFEAGIVDKQTGTSIENNIDITIPFKSGFSKAPDVLVKGQTMNNTDGYWARGSGAWSKDQIKVYAEEDQKNDSERTHPAEIFGYVAFDPSSLIRVMNPTGERLSDIFDLGAFVVNRPIVTTWKSNNYSKVNVFVKVSSNYGIRWSDWLPCGYAKTIPGLPPGGDLSGYSVQFKYTFMSDINLIPNLTEFTLSTDKMMILIEGLNVGGYATDGSDWNTKKIM